jgi:hypothetical protein
MSANCPRCQSTFNIPQLHMWLPFDITKEQLAIIKTFQ